MYRGEQPMLGRKVVVKVLRENLRGRDVQLQRFLREAHLAARLDHPCAAHIYAFDGEEDGLVWIAMEYVQGTTLKQWLCDHGPMSIDELVPFFEDVAEVVQNAHEHGIVHRDLKPANIMVTVRGGRLIPKLLDFGVAKLLAGEPLPESTPHTLQRLRKLGSAKVSAEELKKFREKGASTVTGNSPVPGTGRLTPDDATIGTPGYMAPEQWSREFFVGPAADLYALGVIAYEALTSHRPFEDLEERSRSAIRAMREPPSLDQVPPLGDSFPPALDLVFQRALALRPEARFGDALELAGALRAASGLGASPADLPRLDAGVRNAARLRSCSTTCSWCRATMQPSAGPGGVASRARSPRSSTAGSPKTIRCCSTPMARSAWTSGRWPRCFPRPRARRPSCSSSMPTVPAAHA
ncbi:MAG TPA: serine/threonine-protein kinase [Kofleriaceae bacterium]|nr:serine/threonine-protein kinase [Kofleriaceae bacterium]